MNLWWLLLVPAGPMLIGASACAVIWLFNWNWEHSEGDKATVKGGSYRQWFVFWCAYPPLIIVGWFGGMAATILPWVLAFAT